MNYLSVCSGIEAVSVAWQGLFNPVAFSEIEPFPCAVLKHHYPNVPNWGDMTKFKEWPNETVDILVGGTPCQSFSVAGLRKGLEDPRGNLMLTFLGIADKYKPQWIAWENVPGVLSSGKGRDFGTFLGALGELGYGFSWRILDAKNFGVPQRRRRVFVVGYLGDWRPAGTVLFESESLRRDLAPSREKGKDVTETAGTLASSGGGLNRPAGNANELDFCVVSRPLKAKGNSEHREDSETYIPAISHCIESQAGQRNNPSNQTFLAFDSRQDCVSSRSRFGSFGSSHPQAQAVVYGIDEEQNAHEEQMGCLKARTTGGGFEGAVAFPQNQAGDLLQTEVVPSMGTNQNATGRNTPKTLVGMHVRRLTPVECERLQGFPDNYTLIPWRKGMAPDGPRYKALGNSMCVNVMRWIGERMKKAPIRGQKRIV